MSLSSFLPPEAIRRLSMFASRGSTRSIRGKMLRCWLVLALSAFLIAAVVADAAEGGPDGLGLPGESTNKTAGVLGEQKTVEDPRKVSDGENKGRDLGTGSGKEEEAGGHSVDGDAVGGKESIGEGDKEDSRGDSSSGLASSKDNTAHVEECDSPNKCVDEKNKFVACLRVPGNDSPTLSLLIQNKGTKSLNVKILAPDYVSLENNDVLLNADEDKKVKVTVEYGVNNTPILLSAGDGHCNLSFWDMIPNSIREAEGYTVPLHVSFFIRSIFIYLALALLVLLGAVWLWVKFQRVDSRYQKLDGNLPVSSGGIMENDVAGWDNNWDGSWDDEEAPRTPSKSLSSLSSKGLASRKFNKDGWKD